ncbi:MAG: aspartate-semialdehyde dehydrogenase [Treponema sp.]|jgi:aspartate-semialdehyde dehydrogenase|nr:aspartate-semialdehyde dehydrogenase [Treponema sp.]
MSAKIPVGILGATGMVGQMYVSLLADHPWFEAAYLAASPRSAGKPYREAVTGRWVCERGGKPAHWGNVGDVTVEDAGDVSRALGKCLFVFSALEMEKDRIRALEESYASQGIPVVSNASANRTAADIPMLIAEVNHHHVEVIPVQKKNRGWDGFIVVKPNCSIQSYVTPFYALLEKGYEIKRALVTTMQAVSGAGYPGVPSLDMIDNLVPFIDGEEEKSENEPLKILGSVGPGGIVNAETPLISAHCNRVAITSGHTACVSLEFGAKKPSIDEVKKIWRDFRALPQTAQFPSAPPFPVMVMEERDRPQPRKDRDAGNGMAVSVGRVRPCKLFDLRFTGLSHNTIRGAAGGGVLSAELLKHKGYF